MFCKNCGTALEDTANACPNCGTVQTAQQPVVTYVAPAAPAIPEENRPLSPWAYFGLQLLFAVPIVGFIFLIIFSCNGSNINRRNFARSYWCSLLIAAIIIAVCAVFAVIAGISLSEMF